MNKETIIKLLKSCVVEDNILALTYLEDTSYESLLEYGFEKSKYDKSLLVFRRDSGKKPYTVHIFGRYFRGQMGRSGIVVRKHLSL